MRRSEFEITDYNEMLEVVKECSVCRVALNDGPVPYVVPMNFGFEDDNGHLVLYFHGAQKGKKIDLINENNGAASFEMDAGHELVGGKSACNFTYHYKCVMGTGKIELLETMPEKRHGFKKIMKQYTDDENLPMEEKMVERTAVLKLTAESWSCKARS